MPIGAVGNLFFNAFTNPADSPVTQTQQVLAKLSEIQKSTLESDFNGKFNIALNQRVGDMGIEELFYGELFTFPRKWRN